MHVTCRETPHAEMPSNYIRAVQPQGYSVQVFMQSNSKRRLCMLAWKVSTEGYTSTSDWGTCKTGGKDNDDSLNIKENTYSLHAINVSIFWSSCLKLPNAHNSWKGEIHVLAFSWQSAFDKKKLGTVFRRVPCIF